MKRVTASEARRNWFRLLDEIAAGEVVVVERGGRRILLRREEQSDRDRKASAPNYCGLIEVPDADAADTWRWDWTGSESELQPRKDHGS